MSLKMLERFDAMRKRAESAEASVEYLLGAVAKMEIENKCLVNEGADARIRFNMLMRLVERIIPHCPEEVRAVFLEAAHKIEERR